MTITFTLKNFSSEGEKELEKDLKELETLTKKPKEYHIKEAIIRYLEDMEDLRIALVRDKEGGKFYTTKELEQKLGI